MMKVLTLLSKKHDERITDVSWYMYIQRVCMDILTEKQQRVKREGLLWCVYVVFLYLVERTVAVY